MSELQKETVNNNSQNTQETPPINSYRQEVINSIPITTLAPVVRKLGRPRKGEERPKNLKLRKDLKYRRLSTGQKLSILALTRLGLTTREIAFKEKVSERTIEYIKADEKLNLLLDNNKAMETTKRTLGNNFYLLADSALTRAQDPEKLDNMNAYQLAGIAALSYDKARLAEGLSTENISIRGMVSHIQEEKNNLTALRERLEREVRGISENSQTQGNPA